MAGTDIDETIAMLRARVDAAPGDVNAWMNLSLALQQIGDMQGATACYTKAQAIEPSGFLTWNPGLVIVPGLATVHPIGDMDIDEGAGIAHVNVKAFKIGSGPLAPPECRLGDQPVTFPVPASEVKLAGARVQHVVTCLAWMRADLRGLPGTGLSFASMVARRYDDDGLAVRASGGALVDLRFVFRKGTATLSHVEYRREDNGPFVPVLTERNGSGVVFTEHGVPRFDAMADPARAASVITRRFDVGGARHELSVCDWLRNHDVTANNYLGTTIHRQLELFRLFLASHIMTGVPLGGR